MSLPLLTETAISVAVANQLGPTFAVASDAVGITCVALFNYGSSVTTVKAWVQTSLDDGTTWHDIINFAFTTSALDQIAAVNSMGFAGSTAATMTDASLGDDVIDDGLLGDMIRVKYTTTGTYAGTTNLTVFGVVKTLSGRQRILRI